MKIAVVGSRTVIPSEAQLSEHLADATEIVSGGARGVDTCARIYARRHNLKLTEFLPKYELYGRRAPILRNYEIVDYAEKVLVFWNGTSRGTLSVIKYAEKTNKPCDIIIMQDTEF